MSSAQEPSDEEMNRRAREHHVASMQRREARLSPERARRAHKAKLAELGERVLSDLREWSARVDYPAKWEGFADSIEAAARSLGLLDGEGAQ